MEAPKKIYIDDFGSELSFDWHKEHCYEKDIEYIRTDAFIENAKEAFCKATCNDKLPRSTCTSLGTCKEYDNFVKFMRKNKVM